MSFDRFLAAIQSEELRAVAAHWQAARGSKPLPDAARPLGPDFKPEQVTFFPLDSAV